MVKIGGRKTRRLKSVENPQMERKQREIVESRENEVFSETGGMYEFLGNRVKLEI